MIKIIIGIVFIIGGLSGKLVLVGTNSGVALAALGAALVVWGIINLVRRSQRSGGNNQPPTPPPGQPGT
jgi:predicted phage tail protein